MFRRIVREQRLRVRITRCAESFAVDTPDIDEIAQRGDSARGGEVLLRGMLLGMKLYRVTIRRLTGNALQYLFGAATSATVAVAAEDADRACEIVRNEFDLGADFTWAAVEHNRPVVTRLTLLS